MAETGSRWASLDRGRALIVSLVLAIVLIASVLAALPTPAPIATSPTTPAAAPKANEDLTLYRTIVERVAAGKERSRVITHSFLVVFLAGDSVSRGVSQL